uniref:Tyrosine-protein kinase BAZ1B n=1 Tax=Periophthalmus magnuspinnatus TaxID=409849 RepID=A0A3B4A691_9GOBI
MSFTFLFFQVGKDKTLRVNIIKIHPLENPEGEMGDKKLEGACDSPSSDKENGNRPEMKSTELCTLDTNVSCTSPGDDEKLILCDECNKAFHLFCLRPALYRIPVGEWLCPACQPTVAPRRGSRSRYEDPSNVLYFALLGHSFIDPQGKLGGHCTSHMTM